MKNVLTISYSSMDIKCVCVDIVRSLSDGSVYSRKEIKRFSAWFYIFFTEIIKSTYFESSIILCISHVLLL